MSRQLLLLSNSTNHGEAYLAHARESIVDFLGDGGAVVFVPYALADHAAYTATAREHLGAMGYAVHGLHEAADPRAALREASAVFVGGGNSFRLLDRLQREGLVEILRERVGEGLRYMGASAGTNMACPTLMTTNDMPIVQPASFEALGLVDFQINPHYLDPVPGIKHMGETRETRLREYLEENDRVVLGLREGGWLRVDGASVELVGPRTARLFRRGAEPRELEPGPIADALG